MTIKTLILINIILIKFFNFFFMKRTLATIVCSSDYTLSISHEGVFYFGFLVDIQLQTVEQIFPPRKIPSLEKIKSIDSRLHCACLDYDGNVYTFGVNFYGQLGIGDHTVQSTNIPQKVELPPCKQVSCGATFTFCLTENGVIYGFGLNVQGQLALEKAKVLHLSPQKITSLKDVEFIECGYSYTFCKTLNNEIFCWGENSLGQLGLGNTDDQDKPILCSSLLDEDVVDIKCGERHTLVLTSNQNVLSCGNTEYGQLGREDINLSTFQKIAELLDIIRIECGSHHSLCIDINNNLFVFGSNSFGQLGLGDTKNRNKPIKHPSLSNIIDISKGGNHTFVKTSNNEIYAFGNNECSQLGIKTEDNKQLTPIRVFEENEDIWYSSVYKSKAKSARF